MRRLAALLTGLAGLLLLGMLPSVAAAAEPPNRNDPCSNAGRDTCNTTSRGFYDTYRYGIRWFGSYKAVVPGAGNVFCIDLRFWFPATQHRYREISSASLRNRDGRVVSTTAKRRMAYAVWTFGRRSGRNMNAAMMLYVHSLMGDARPGEVDPRELGNPAVTRLYSRIARDSARYAGPYTISARVPSGLRVGKETDATVRIRSASGAPIRNARVRVRVSGAAGAARVVRTNNRGQARLSFTPNSATNGISLTAEAQVASTLPKLYNATRGLARRNSQRVAAPNSQTITATVTKRVAPARVTITTQAEPQTLLVGESTRDRVTVGGLPPARRAKVDVRLYGPFRSTEEIQCSGTPAATTSFVAQGSGETLTDELTPTEPGIYTYQLSVEGNADVIGTTTPCGVPEETIRVETQPAVTTVVSDQSITPGTPLFDRVLVTGLNGEAATVTARLYGPFPTREAIQCDGEPVWTGTIRVTGDSEVNTERVTLPTPGYYTYVESIAAEGFVRAADHPCGLVSQTSVVTGSPSITTRISDRTTNPGDTVTDTVEVSGLGALSAPVEVELHGPFPTRDAIQCDGEPYARSTFTATGDGTYETEPVTVDEAGYYTYIERIADAEAYAPHTTECGLVSETTFTRAVPKVTTRVSKQIASRGSRIFDRVKVTGIGKTRVPVRLELFGPFPTRDAIRCDGRPVWTGQVVAKGDGTFRSGTYRVRRAGFYSYRESVQETELVRGSRSKCAIVAETSLAAPAINTGRGDTTKLINARDAGARTPTRVRISGLGINARVFTSGIDVARNQLGVPEDVRRLGWWRDGRAPGDRAGAVLIAGHTDSARQGPGAFFALDRRPTVGQIVSVDTRGGRTYRYRITSTRSVLKARLPNNVFSTRGRARLVLVTCGGPFNERTGFYRDNIVVTARPI